MAQDAESGIARAPPFAASMADLMVDIGHDGRILAVSRSVTAIAGYEVKDLEGRFALDLIHRDDRFRVLRHFIGLRTWAGSSLSRPLQMRARHQGGRWIWFEGNPAAVIDPATGLMRGWVDVLRDIEASRAREHGLLVAKRAAEAEAAAQSEFLANMSHEIRTPLNSMIGFMQVLKQDASLGEVQLGHVRYVEEAGRHLLSVVNDVLDLSKIESGTVRLNERPFRLGILMAETAALIRPQAVQKGLRLDVESGPAAATMVIGDPDRLRQILFNLLSNAVKFTLQGQVRLRLDARPDDPLLDLAFVIEDSGIGIAPEQLPKLFRRFSQADGTIAARFGGTGLGLAISKRLVEAMGGSIEVESTTGSGSRFVVRVRLRRADSAVAASEGTAAPPGASYGATLRGGRILVAEDIAINQKLVEAMLATLGCEIEFVSDGAEALRTVQIRPYDLVLMDMQMPILDGVETTRAIRALGGRFAALPIVALTANVFPEKMQQARAAGMNDFITKPIDSDHLLATVLKWAAPRQP